MPISILPPARESSKAMKKIITLSGSARSDSLNSRLAQLMGEKMRALGADVTDISLADYPLPIFDADLEKNDHPAAAGQLAELFIAADGIFIATPEYNGSITPLLKNAIDWISREKGKPYAHATFGIGAVSTGKLSGILAIGHLRDILGKIGALTAPTALAIPHFSVTNGFGEDGDLTDPVLKARAEALANELLTITRKSA